MNYKDVVEYTGMIIDADDPQKLGRVKCAIAGLFDSSKMKVENMPWIYPRSAKPNTFSLPTKGLMVKVYNNINNYSEFWYEPMFTLDNTARNLIESQDNSEVILCNANGNLSLQIYSNDTDGIMIKQNKSKILLQPNGNVEINGGNGNISMAINNGCVELGDLAEDTEYGVMGDLLESLLQGIADGLSLTALKAMSIPYVQFIADNLLAMSTNIEDALQTIKAKNTKLN